MNVKLKYHEPLEQVVGAGLSSSDDRDPVECIIKRDEQNLLQSAIRCLSPKLREPILLFYLGERSVAEIGEILGTPVGTIKRRLHDARRILRSELIEAMADEKTNIENSDITGRIKEYISLAKEELKRHNTKHASDLCDEALRLISSDAIGVEEFYETLFDLYDAKVNAIRYVEGTEATLEYRFKQIEILKKIGNTKGLVSYLGGMGADFSNMKKPDDALRYYKMAYETAKEAGLEELYGDCLYWLGIQN